MVDWKWKPSPPKRTPKKEKKKEHRWRWMMHGIPMANGQPTGFTVEDADAQCAHLEMCGLVWGPDLVALADANGYVHIDQIPRQQIKQLPPEHGPDIWVNPTGKWVPVDTPAEAVAPEPLDLTELTDDQVALIEAEQEVIRKALEQRQINRELIAGADPHVRDALTGNSTDTDTEGEQL